jgi:hypothetical protein
MNIPRILLLTTFVVVGTFLAACTAAPTTDVDAAVATAVATSVAATVAAQAPAATSATTQPSTASTPTATLIKLRISESRVDGDDGNDFLRGGSETNQGRVILLPGFEDSLVTAPMVFRDRIVFRVEVFDTRAGLSDGAGIQEVTFRIEPEDGSGQVVYEKLEQKPGYCVFGGGEPDCEVLTFAQSGYRWPGPGGGPIRNGPYLARIDIIAANGESTQWRWRFQIDIPGQPALNAARINRITVQNGRYVVDFETFGFEPLVPGQHVHFFFDSVPPDQAGMPGKGPWQLYPTGPGQTNASPFTLYTVAQRPTHATKMCILVANPDHSVRQGTGNCVDLP